MMKRIIPFFAGFIYCTTLCIAGYSDGFITAGEYEFGVQWFSNNPPLIVDGGGADIIEVRDHGLLEVKNTSIPINGNWHSGGIRDIWIDDFSKLLYLNGESDVISLDEYATATLKGGQINSIRSFQYVGWVGRNWVDPYIEIICRDYVSSPTLITGTWNADNDNNGQWDTFSIQLLNQSGYSPVIDNIKFTIIPEPASLLLLGLGGLLLRKRK